MSTRIPYQEKKIRKIPTSRLRFLHEALGTLRGLAKARKVPEPRDGICFNILHISKGKDQPYAHEDCIEVITWVTREWRLGNGTYMVYPFGQSEDPDTRWVGTNLLFRLALIRYTRLRITRELNRRSGK